MLALKMISSVLVIASSAGIGMYFSSTLKERLETIRELKKVMLLLRGNITYSNATLPEALNSIANRQKGELKDFLSYVSSELYQMNGKTMRFWMPPMANGWSGGGNTCWSDRIRR